MSDIQRFHLDGCLYLEVSRTGEVWLAEHGGNEAPAYTRLTLKALRELNKLLIEKGLGNV